MGNIFWIGGKMNKININIILNKLMHKRFKTIKDICEFLVEQEEVIKVDLFEDTEMEIICDNALIGTIYVNDKNTEREFDFQLWYIKDNLEQYYITEVECLEEVTLLF